MSKKGTKALASATLLSLVLTTALSAGPVKAAATGQTTRIAGADRYATAAAVATKDGKTNDNVVLVSGEGYADAVSGSVLAKTIDAPILLTQSNTLSADTTKALNTLKPKNIYVIGGTASVSQSIRDQLKDGGYNLVELGGANRYETNVAVANELVKNHGISADKVMVVGGEGFSDALSVAPVAAAKGQILLLGSNSQNDMKSVIDFVNTNKSSATVVGTSNIMNDSILKALGVDPSTRINGGADRFATNLNVLKAFSSDLKADSIYVANATADDGYADALVASALAGKTASPLILVDTDDSSATTNALSYYNSEKTDSTSTYVVGGEGVISKDLYVKFGGQSTTNPVDNNDVKSIDSVGLNQIKVVFDTDVDSDSAEDVGNYKINGITLNNRSTKDSITTDADDNSAVAKLQDDNRTVLITLNKSRDQQKSYTVSVKNGVLTADKSQTIEAKDQSVTFSDTEAPTISSVTAKGNSKLTVKFSEPIKVKVQAGKDAAGEDKYVPTNEFTGKFKINDQNISGFGLNTSYSEVKNAVIDKADASKGTYVWSDEVDLYFSSKLPTGSNTLKVDDGDVSDNLLSDAGGFYVHEQEQNFTIDAVTTKPQVKEVTCDPDGTIWVRFDRPMDSQTAIKGGNYGINGDNETLSENGTLKENDYTVKFKDVSSQTINDGSNTIYISNSVKDAYGNTVDDDTRVNFTKTKDETKPVVNSISMIDSETIRILFSKDVTAATATNLSNYTLKDSNGVDITKHIRIVKPSNKSVDDTTTYGAISGSFGSDNAWDIKMWKSASDAHATDPTDYPSTVNDDWKLTGSKYTLTIKNLKDTTTNGNTLDEITKELDGADDVAPKMDSIAYANSSKKIVLTFSEAMDSSTLNDKSNYQYKNKSGDSKAIPSDTKITLGTDNKSVTLEFPDSYHMYDSNAGKAYEKDSISGVDSDNIVTGILASGLKDVSGNIIDSFNNTANVSVTGNGGVFGVKDNTIRVTNEGDDVVVKVQFDKSIDMDTVGSNGDYKMTFAGMQPDSINSNGSDIELRFNKGTKAAQKIEDAYAETALSDGTTKNKTVLPSGLTTDNIDTRDVIKLYGAKAKLNVTSDVKDITGAKADTNGIANAKVFNYTVAPQVEKDYFYTEKGTTSSAVVLTFDTDLDAGASKVKKDDFTFYVGNNEVKADNVYVSGNSLIFKFTKDNAKFTGADSNIKNVKVSLKGSSVDSIDLEAIADDNGDNAKYIPASDDTETRNAPIYTGDSAVNTWLNSVTGGSDF